MDFKEKLGAVIRAAREDYGLSQDKLASKAEVSTRHYQAIEAGEKQPTFETLFKIAHASERDYTDLLGPLWTEWLAEQGGE